MPLTPPYPLVWTWPSCSSVREDGETEALRTLAAELLPTLETRGLTTGDRRLHHPPAPEGVGGADIHGAARGRVGEAGAGGGRGA